MSLRLRRSFSVGAWLSKKVCGASEVVIGQWSLEFNNYDKELFKDRLEKPY
jgi:hypothetical protein